MKLPPAGSGTSDQFWLMLESDALPLKPPETEISLKAAASETGGAKNFWSKKTAGGPGF